MKIKGIGVDIIEIQRFRSLLKRKKNPFFERVFSKIEIEYCMSYNDPAVRFAGTFAAKEAVQKTLDKAVGLEEIEIRRDGKGKPHAWLKGRRSRVLISISHSQETACAIAIRQ